MSNANKLKENLAWRKLVNEEIAAGNVVNTKTNVAAFHAAQAALAANLGSTPINQLPYPSLFEEEEEEEAPAAASNGLRQRLIQNPKPKPKKGRRKGSNCCKGSVCTIMGGQRRRKTKRRRNY
jgi:hypothetical protein